DGHGVEVLAEPRDIAAVSLGVAAHSMNEDEGVATARLDRPRAVGIAPIADLTAQQINPNAAHVYLLAVFVRYIADEQVVHFHAFADEPLLQRRSQEGLQRPPVGADAERPGIAADDLRRVQSTLAWRRLGHRLGAGVGLQQAVDDPWIVAGQLFFHDGHVHDG